MWWLEVGWLGSVREKPEKGHFHLQHGRGACVGRGVAGSEDGQQMAMGDA